MKIVAAVLLIAVAAGACSIAVPTSPLPITTPPITATPASTTAPPRTPCPAIEPEPIDASAVATLGPTQHVPPSPAKGERLTLDGVILLPDCSPAGNTVISWWQADAAGHYGPPAPPGDLNCCYYAVTVATDASGRFEIHTVRPATDPAPDAELPAHMHVAIGTLQTSGRDVVIRFADDPRASQEPRGAFDLTVSLERRSDAAGSYWFGYLQIVARPPGT